MIIKRFELSPPCEDGDMYASSVVEIENSTKDEIRLIRSSFIYVNNKGIPFYCTANDDQDVCLEPGEMYEFNSTGFLSSQMCGEARDDVSVRVLSTLYSCEYNKLGEVEIVANSKQYSALRKTITSNVVDNEIVVVVACSPPSDDGSVCLAIRCGIRNLTDSHCDKILLKTELLDKRGDVIGTDESCTELPSRGAVCIEGNISDIKKSRVKEARCRCSLSVFSPILRKTCEAVSSPCEE